MQKMTANICMYNESNKYNVEQRIANFFIHSLEAGAKMISCCLHAVGMTGSSANQLFKIELHLRFTMYMVIGPKLTSNYLICSFGKENGFVKGAMLSA